MPAPAVMAGLSAASSMLGPLVGLLQNIKGPRQRRQEEQQAAEKRRQEQLAGYRAAAQGGMAQNPQAVAGGGTLPLPSPPIAQQAPVALPETPQVQLQQPGPLGGQRNDYLMKLLMQGNR